MTRLFPALLAGLFMLGVPSGPLGEEPENYGRTPDTAIPYRNFHEPYARFYQAPVPFLGEGRERDPKILPQSVRIGFFGPTDEAPDGDLGQSMLEGVQLAMEQANAAGGYQGIPFELVQRQDTGLWGASSNEMVAFKYEDHVLAVIGSIDGANTHIALRVALKIQLPMVNTATTDPTLTETSVPWLLRCMADDRQQGYALAYHIFKECGLKSAVAFRVNDRYGRTGIAEFRDASRRLGHPLRSELRWDRGERDFSRQLDRIAQIGPDAVVIWGNARDAAAVVQEIKRRKMPVRIFGSDRLASRTFIDVAGEAAEGVVAAASYDPSGQNPRLQSFNKAFSERFDRLPDTFAAHAYDGAQILIDSVHQSGLNSIRIRDALYGYSDYEGVTGLIEFDTTLNDVGAVYIATIQNGTLVYREADFAQGVEPRTQEPYYAMDQSPPQVQSPNRTTHGDTLRIGCFLPLDETGQRVVQGMRQALVADAAQFPGATPIDLVVHDARGAWGDNSSGLVDMTFEDNVVALVGSTERRGTHLAEMMAAKFHFPVLSLCATDPTITQIPLPWVFCVASEEAGEATGLALGYDAAKLLVDGIRQGNHTRKELRDAVAKVRWHEGMSGMFCFDTLGNRIER